MNKKELDIKLEAYRQRNLLKETRASWLVYMAREDSSRFPIQPLDKKRNFNFTWREDPDDYGVGDRHGP